MLSRLALVLFLAFSLAAPVMVQDADTAWAATTKKKKTISHKRSDFTPEQREKMMEEARKLCKKRYGAGASVYKIDYVKWTVWCQEG